MKLLLFRRRTLAVLACLLAATAMFTAVQYPAAVSAAATQRQLPIYCVQRDQKMVAISFDAAWGDDRKRSPERNRSGDRLIFPTHGRQSRSPASLLLLRLVNTGQHHIRPIPGTLRLLVFLPHHT
ncbi:hypothetical protein [Flavonifractor hominis]|uniref:Uncharacterized protein n=1 Tax=Flavonifractor hominis TaxID=3133178 RepID=A0ABV1EN35_9FIRM